jgi:hypothetical protein
VRVEDQTEVLPPIGLSSITPFQTETLPLLEVLHDPEARKMIADLMAHLEVSLGATKGERSAGD